MVIKFEILDNAPKEEPITVAQLIAKLQQFPPDMRVVVEGYEGGYHDAGWLKNEDLILKDDAPSSYDQMFGRHEFCYTTFGENGENKTTVLVIAR